ncbi:hypothetical protein KBF38_24300 [bacterium]|nr:hypothetical protein [bacterium]
MFDFNDESFAEVSPGQQLISILNRTGDYERAFETPIKTLAHVLNAERIVLVEILDGETVVTHFYSLDDQPIEAQAKSLDSMKGMQFILNFLAAQQAIITLSEELANSDDWKYYLELCGGKSLASHHLALIATQLAGAAYGVLVVQTSNKNTLSDFDREVMLGLRDALAVSIDRRNTFNHWKAKIEEATALQNELIKYKPAEIQDEKS